MDFKDEVRFAPSVSIVVPVYSGANTLEQLVKRVQAIRNKNEQLLGTPLLHELVFVCDDPIDRSTDIVQSLEKQFSWIRVITLARNSGQHLATAIGLMHSSGDWIVTLDEDLQHPPELIVELLHHVLTDSSDICYAKSTARVHSHIWYRDISSSLSKHIIGLFTREKYDIISSYRLIRGEIARSIAFSVDKNSYLDVSLLTYISPSRRTSFLANYSEAASRKSGYSLFSLITHYGRLISNVELSGMLIIWYSFLFIALPVAIVLIGFLIYSASIGVQSFAPGWLSLFTIVVFLGIAFGLYALYSLKIINLIYHRSIGLPSVITIDRSLDKEYLSYLSQRPLHKELPE